MNENTTTTSDDALRLAAEMRAEADALALAKGTAALPDAMRTLRDAYTVLAFAFNRLHGSARSRDTELCGDIGKTRAKIEAVFRKAGERL